ncbi:MAG: hypothetical protein ABL958_14400, partial [Bdellovibrionia bacterium]
LLAARPVPTGVAQWDFFIVGCDDARFRRPVIPGDVLEMRCTLTRDRQRMISFECEAKVDGHVTTQANIMATMVPVTKARS